VQKGRRAYQMHGLTVLKRAVNTVGNRLIDKRTVTGRALAKWRADLIGDLGGDVSTQQAALIDLAVKSKLLLDSIDAWLLTQPTLINSRKKTLIPVVRERQSLADGLAKYLMALGLHRKQSEKTLADLLGRGRLTMARCQRGCGRHSMPQSRFCQQCSERTAARNYDKHGPPPTKKRTQQQPSRGFRSKWSQNR